MLLNQGSRGRVSCEQNTCRRQPRWLVGNLWWLSSNRFARLMRTVINFQEHCSLRAILWIPTWKSLLWGQRNRVQSIKAINVSLIATKLLALCGALGKANDRRPRSPLPVLGFAACCPHSLLSSLRRTWCPANLYFKVPCYHKVTILIENKYTSHNRIKVLTGTFFVIGGNYGKQRVLHLWRTLL